VRRPWDTPAGRRGARVLPWDQTSPRPARANGKLAPGVSPIRAPSRLPSADEDEEEFAM